MQLKVHNFTIICPHFAHYYWFILVPEFLFKITFYDMLKTIYATKQGVSEDVFLLGVMTLTLLGIHSMVFWALFGDIIPSFWLDYVVQSMTAWRP